MKAQLKQAKIFNATSSFNKAKFNGVYSKNNLPKKKDGAYLTHLDGYEPIGTHWTALYVIAENLTYCDSFGVEHIPKKIRKFIGNKSITTNIYRIQAYDSIMCGYFCIGCTDFMLKDIILLEYTNLFSPSKYKNNYKIILKYFQWNLNKLKCIALFAINIENLKELKYHIFLKKH